MNIKKVELNFQWLDDSMIRWFDGNLESYHHWGGSSQIDKLAELEQQIQISWLFQFILKDCQIQIQIRFLLNSI